MKRNLKIICLLTIFIITSSIAQLYGVDGKSNVKDEFTGSWIWNEKDQSGKINDYIIEFDDNFDFRIKTKNDEIITKGSWKPEGQKWGKDMEPTGLILSYINNDGQNIYKHYMVRWSDDKSKGYSLKITDYKIEGEPVEMTREIHISLVKHEKQREKTYNRMINNNNRFRDRGVVYLNQKKNINKTDNKKNNKAYIQKNNTNKMTETKQETIKKETASSKIVLAKHKPENIKTDYDKNKFKDRGVITLAPNYDDAPEIKHFSGYDFDKSTSNKKVTEEISEEELSEIKTETEKPKADIHIAEHKPENIKTDYSIYSFKDRGAVAVNSMNSNYVTAYDYHIFNLREHRYTKIIICGY